MKGNNMKKKITAVVLSLFLLFMIFGGVFVTQFEKIVDWKQINDDKLTTEELASFEKQLNTKTFYYYNNLNEKQKQAYIAIYSMFQNFTDSRRITISADEIKDVFVAVLYDNSEIFWVDLNYEYIDYGESVEFSPVYRLEKAEADKMTESVEDIVKEIIKNSEKFATDYEKELFFHDYICQNTVYDETSFNDFGDTAYSSLISGKSICEGYSRAMQLLLDRAGIRNYLVIGDGVTEENTEPHMWNIVEIDGKNYHLDVTWNDTGTEEGYGYLYFNVTDEFISRDHLNLVPQINNCTYVDANYFVMNDLFISNFNGFDSLISPVSAMLKNGDNTVEIVFADKTEFDKAIDELENNNYMFFSFIEESVKRSGRNLLNQEIEYITIDESYYLCLIYKEG